jgi:hypothetical protein
MAKDVLNILVVGDGARSEPLVGVGEKEVVIIDELIQEALLEREEIGNGPFFVELIADPAKELAKSGEHPAGYVAVGRSPVGFNEEFRVMDIAVHCATKEHS